MFTKNDDNRSKKVLFIIRRQKSQKLKIKILLNENTYYKIHEIVFAYVSEHCASFGTENSICSFLKGRGKEPACCSPGITRCYFFPFLLSLLINTYHIHGFFSAFLDKKIIQTACIYFVSYIHFSSYA